MPSPLASGQRFGAHYQLLHELGQGGMATVWLAQDLRHDRRVACKIIRPELAAAVGQSRFLQEIALTARLQHPHLLPLFDSGEADGHLFYVMPYVEGGTLRDRLDRTGRIPLEEAIRITGEIADALAYAHREGILHRDLKPENILFSGGHALLADFGIARAVTPDPGERLTATGLAIGTPAYMSPEQLLAEEAQDGRSDQYALAVIAYEMVAGQPPFAGGSAQSLLARRLIEAAPPLARAGVQAPQTIERALARALAREPGDRFADVAAFAAALTASGSSAEAPAPAGSSVIVLDFHNLTGRPDHDWLGTGIAATVSTDLQRVAAVSVLPRPQAPVPPGASAADLGLRAGARWVVTGSYQVMGPRVRITPQFLDLATGRTTGDSKLDGTLDDIFALQDEIVTAFLRAAAIEPTATEAAEIARPETARLAAYEAYARGRQKFNGFGPQAFTEAAALFREAIVLDPGYALAHAALGSVAVFRYIVSTDPADLTEGIAQLQRAAELDPGRAEPFQWLTYAYNRAGRPDEAEAAGTRATTLEPGNGTAHYFLAGARTVRADQGAGWAVMVTAAESLIRALVAEPEYVLSAVTLSHLYGANGEYRLAHAVLDLAQAVEATGRSRGPSLPGSAGYARARLLLREGRETEVAVLADHLVDELGRQSHMYAPSLLALTHWLRGELAVRRAEWDRAVREFLRMRDLAEQHRRRLGVGFLFVRAQTSLGRALLGLGDRGEGERQAAQGRDALTARSEWDFGWAWDQNHAAAQVDLAAWYAAAGQAAEAVACLKAAVALGWGDIGGLERDPGWAAMANGPALQSLRAEVAGRAPLPAPPV